MGKNTRNTSGPTFLNGFGAWTFIGSTLRSTLIDGRLGLASIKLTIKLLSLAPSLLHYYCIRHLTTFKVSNLFWGLNLDQFHSAIYADWRRPGPGLLTDQTVLDLTAASARQTAGRCWIHQTTNSEWVNHASVLQFFWPGLYERSTQRHGRKPARRGAPSWL